MKIGEELREIAEKVNMKNSKEEASELFKQITASLKEYAEKGIFTIELEDDKFKKLYSANTQTINILTNLLKEEMLELKMVRAYRDELVYTIKY